MIFIHGSTVYEVATQILLCEAHFCNLPLLGCNLLLQNSRASLVGLGTHQRTTFGGGHQACSLEDRRKGGGGVK